MEIVIILAILVGFGLYLKSTEVSAIKACTLHKWIYKVEKGEKLMTCTECRYTPGNPKV